MDQVAGSNSVLNKAFTILEEENLGCLADHCLYVQARNHDIALFLTFKEPEDVTQNVLRNLLGDNVPKIRYCPIQECEKRQEAYKVLINAALENRSVGALKLHEILNFYDIMYEL